MPNTTDARYYTDEAFYAGYQAALSSLTSYQATDNADVALETWLCAKALPWTKDSEHSFKSGWEYGIEDCAEGPSQPRRNVWHERGLSAYRAAEDPDDALDEFKRVMNNGVYAITGAQIDSFWKAYNEACAATKDSDDKEGRAA